MTADRSGLARGAAALALVALALGPLAACGKKGDPEPPGGKKVEPYVYPKPDPAPASPSGTQTPRPTPPPAPSPAPDSRGRT